MHFAYWPPQLNVKVLPPNVKRQITELYENEFYPWCRENWNKFTGVERAGISYDEWVNAPYGIKRFQGIINFMNSEDWSQRLPETKEWIRLVNRSRGWDNKFLDVFPIFEEIINE